MRKKRIFSLLVVLSMILSLFPQLVFAEEYISIKDLADANGYEYFAYPEKDTVNVRSTSYILAFQNGNKVVAYKTILSDEGTVTLENEVKKDGDVLCVSKLDAQTKLIKYFPNTPSETVDKNNSSQPAATPVKETQKPYVSDSGYSGNSPSDWAVSEINDAESNGLVTSNVKKNYQADISREYFCELAVKLYEKATGEDAEKGANPFDDTSNSEIIKAYHLGIVNGVSRTEFAPNNKITRQEICAMLVRAVGAMYPNIDLTDYTYHRFTDESSISSWAIDSVQFAYDNEIMQGTGNNCISPLGNATCEQAILLVNRIYENRRSFEKKNEDSKAVTETLKTLDFDDDSEVKSVSVSFADGSSTENVKIKEIKESDPIYTTTGIKGSAVSIKCDDDFDKATISFEYNPDGLGGSKPEDLAVAWYNTDLDRIEVLESNVNSAANTVSVETTHFSEYLLVDSREWYSIWQRAQAITRDTDSDGNYLENFNVQLVVDCSTSMNNGTRFKDAKDSTYEFIYNLVDVPGRSNDKFSVIQFSDNANMAIEETNVNDADLDEIEEAVSNIYMINGTNFNAALEMCLENIDTSGDYNNIIVFLSDGGADSDESILKELRENDVRIASVALGDGADIQQMQRLSDYTNGQFVYADNSEILDSLYDSIRGSLIGVDATDTDGDGIPDIIETTGMKNQYGDIIRTDPNKWDTDGDGKSDIEEMGKLIETDELTEMDIKKGITSNAYFKMKSDPVEGHSVAVDVKQEEQVETHEPPEIQVEFIQKHIDFINHDELYKVIRKDDGFAGLCAKHYQDTHLATMYGVWDGITALGQLLSTLKVDDVNDYDLILYQLLASNESAGQFTQGVQSEFLDNMMAILEILSKIPDETVSSVVMDSIQNIKVYTITEILDYNSALAKKIGDIPVWKMRDTLEKYGTVVGGLGKFVGFLDYLDDQRCTAYSMLTFIATAAAYRASEDEMKDVLTQIHANIVGMGLYTNEGYSKLRDASLLADSIENLIERMEMTQTDPIQALSEEFMDIRKEWTWNTVSYLYQFIIGEKYPQIAVLLNSVSTGVQLSNLLWKIDKFSEYASMGVKIGFLAHAVNDVMKEEQGMLLKYGRYEDAVMFDHSFNMYKNLQILAYNNAIADTNLTMTEGIFNRTDTERDSKIAIWQTEKIKIEKLKCH